MKTQRLIKLLFVSLLLVACKKEYKEDTTVHFHLYNPVTNEAFSNVTVKIVEQKDVSSTLQLSSEYDYKTIWEGKTDADGKASHTFSTLKKDKYTYWHYVDESFMNGKKKIEQPEYAPITKNGQNKREYKIVNDNLQIVRWVKNINCYDVNDRIKFKMKSIVDKYDNWTSWIPNTPSGYYEGCMDYIIDTHKHTQDIVEVEMEVTKNGVTNIIRDTCYLTGQNGTDTLKLFY